MEKYTVVVPTRDRGETLDATLRCCLRQRYENFEIIVSDNCSSDNTHEIVRRLDDGRIKYINPGRRLSMAGNFEFALRHVTDGFVMFIGSDDGIMPGAIEYVDSIVRKYNVEAVSCRQALYVWPNFPDKSIAGKFNFASSRDDVEIRNSSEWIAKTLNFSAFYCFELPNLYCGFVHKRVIDKAYKNGIYFRSITPDSYSAFATAIFLDSYAFSHRPFSIAGASAKSNGASAISPEGNADESNKFIAENDIEVCSGFVNCPSYEIILGETFAQLQKAFPEECAPYDLNYAAMLDKAVANSNERTKKEVADAVSTMAENFAEEIKQTSGSPESSSWVATVWHVILKFCRTLRRFFKITALPTSSQIGIRDIDDAALVAHVLLQRSRKGQFVTVGTAAIKRIFNRLQAWIGS